MEIENLIKVIETVSASVLTGFKYEENGVKLQGVDVIHLRRKDTAFFHSESHGLCRAAAVLRRGAGHNCEAAGGGFVSASAIRAMLGVMPSI